MATKTKERPIIFDGESVRALLAGTKTQTRRAIRPQPPSVEAVHDKSGLDFSLYSGPDYPSGIWRVAGPVWAVGELGSVTEWKCPFGRVGDRLWCREKWARNCFMADSQCTGPNHCHHAATCSKLRLESEEWKSPVKMPRWASRLTLEITAVRVERLQEITEEDAIAEGVEKLDFHRLLDHRVRDAELERLSGRKLPPYYVRAFHAAWDKINGKRHPWASNPWVWCLTFRKEGQRGPTLKECP